MLIRKVKPVVKNVQFFIMKASRNSSNPVDSTFG